MKANLWTTLCFCVGFVLSSELVHGGGRTDEGVEFYNGSPYGARMQLEVPAGADAGQYYIAPGGRLLIPSTDLASWSAFVEWSSPTDLCNLGNPATNGFVYCYSHTFGDAEFPVDTVGTVMLSAGPNVTAGGENWTGLVRRSDRARISVAWWSGMGLGGGVVGVMIVLGIVRRGRSAISRV